jgi:hypothetical protein
MEPRTIVEEQERAKEEFHLQEQFVPQVEDDSLPARIILTDQQAQREPENTPQIFVP